MTFRLLVLYLTIFMLCFPSIESSPSLDNFLLRNYRTLNRSGTPSPITHQSNFLLFPLCHQQEKHRLKLKQKLCWTYIPPYKIQNEGEEGQKTKQTSWVDY